MNKLVRVLHMLLVWTGLSDVSESHMTPDHGWLLPVPARARRQLEDSRVPRAGRIVKTGSQG